MRRLQAMGLEVGPVGRSLVGRLRLARKSFETLAGPIAIDEVQFATVGPDRIKCIAPRLLFALPILRILDCRDATALEARIHLAWQRRLGELRRAASWLSSLGIEPEITEQGSLLRFPLAGESDETRAGCTDAMNVLLPSRGKLSGIPLQRGRDRVLSIDPSVQSGIDLEIAVTNRLEELIRIDDRLSQRRRMEAMQREREARAELSAGDDDAGGKQGRRPTLLLVGPRIARETDCIESLRLRGYDVDAVPSERDAIAAFDRSSPELVLADANLGRSEGLDLIPSLRQVPGIEELPVVLLDGHKRPERREAARRLGAAGYVVYPIDIARISGSLTRIVQEPRRRRFTRYPQELSVRFDGMAETAVATSIGRRGMFVSTDGDLPTGQRQRCRISLPETRRALRIETEVLYRSPAGESGQQGIGLRFNGFPDADETVLIDYLRNLHQPEGQVAGLELR